ncbi:MAG: T9SS type A sorting domain-containing protein [Flavobacteriales bacterium]|nr:T9SS type A sorting domain-containing protein [Flavobacteriales bacterium]
MRKIIVLLSLVICKSINAQQLVFTVQNGSGQDEFWRVYANAPFVYQNLTNELNQHALFAGANKGPISTSHNGDYYIFQSERFDDNIDGYEAITICKSDFSYFEVPKDNAGNAFHSEGIMQVSNDGQTIFFVQGGGTNSRDIFTISKVGSTWTAPVELSTNTGFDYNTSPYLSYDETKILFESSATSDFSTAINEVTNSGVGLSVITTIAAVANNCSQIKSPCYDVSENIYFEGETDAERIWTINASGGTASILNNSFTNDNSPITLPDGSLASLYLPGSTHQIKIMDANGSNDFMVTNSSASFDEVFDIGISAGENGLTGVEEANARSSLLSVYPNPATNRITIQTVAQGQQSTIKIYNAVGQEVFQKSNMQQLSTIDVSSLSSGIYHISLFDGEQQRQGKFVKE